MNNWEDYPDTEETKIEIEENDKVVKIGGYLFVIQRKNEMNNIVFKKIEESKFSLKDVFRAFRFYLITNKIQFIRIEGNLKRYNFLKKMFPQNVFLKDDSIENRNVFYVKVYE